MVFNPDILLQCQRLSMDKQVIELLEYGMELSDIAELVMEENALSEAITECLALLQQIELPALGHEVVMPQGVSV